MRHETTTPSSPIAWKCIASVLTDCAISPSQPLNYCRYYFSEGCIWFCFVVFIMPKTETLIWTSPSDESFIYARINTEVVTTYNQSGSGTITVRPVSETFNSPCI